MAQQANLEQDKKRILVVDDEEVLRGAIKRTLEKAGFEVVTAESGKAAQSLIGLESFSAIVSDIHMPTSNVNGIELLHFVNRLVKDKKSPPIPVILMTGFAELSETKEAAALGAAGFLPKPFKKEDIIEVLGKAIGTIEKKEVAPVEEESNYCRIGIEDFVTGRQIKFTIFIRLGTGKYVKVAHQGEDITVERIRSYLSKGLQYLYLLKDDFRKYLEFNRVLTMAAKSSGVVPPEKKLELARHANEVLLQHFHSDEISPQAFEQARGIVDSTISILCEQRETASLLDMLNRHSNQLYAHSLGVSLYATMICREVGWTSSQTLFKAAIAGLMHDIGKKEIDQKILFKRRIDRTPEEIQLIETHSVRGMEILADVPMFPPDLIQAVLQHHETCTGTGYPAALPKGSIQPLARLLAVADEVCELIIAGPEHEKMSPRDAMMRIQVLHGQNLDPVFIAPLYKILGVSSASIGEEFDESSKVS